MVAAAGGGASSSCLSVFGLAYDSTEREVHVLFSGCPGYLRCILVPSKGSQRPYAFVQFAGQQEALVAMESRQGTTWEEGQAVSIEMAKRDIPDKFTSRQTWNSGFQAAAAPGYGSPIGGTVVQPNKRQRPDVVTYAPQQPAEAADGPRTLHLGGLPMGLTQADLDSFLSTNFGNTCLGGNLDAGGGKGTTTSPRAFVGFSSHQAAAEAQAMLEGFVWDGAQLRAEWARTEYRPVGGGGGAGKGGGGGSFGSSTAVSQWVPPQTSRPANYWERQKEAAQRWDDRGGQGAKCTLHFTNLPFVTEAEFTNFLSGTFPEQVVCAHFKDSHDGRPPVAWVLFADEGSAAAAMTSYQSFTLHGSQVQAQFARTEMDPSKFRR